MKLKKETQKDLALLIKSSDHYIESYVDLKVIINTYIQQNGINSLLTKIQVGKFPLEPIIHHTNFLTEENIKIAGRIYCIVNDITSQPICGCKDCDNPVKWSNYYKKGFRPTCSTSCSSRWKAYDNPISKSTISGKNVSGICKICSQEYKGLQYHVKNTHNMSWGDYSRLYLGLGDKDLVECYECGESHKNLVEHIKSIHNITIKEYKLKYPESLIISENESKRRSDNIMGDKNHMHHKNASLEKRLECSPRNIEYWKNKYPDKPIAELETMKDDFSRKMSVKGGESSDTTLKYYLRKGYDRHIAEMMLADRQNTCGFEKLSEKYGEDEANLMIQKRVSLFIKSIINNDSLLNGSKIANDMFDIIINIMNLDISNVKCKNHNNELHVHIRKNKKNYFYDFTLLDKMKIIEFNGDIFHANPKLYKPSDTPNPFRKGLTSEQLWEYDKTKIQAATDRGYQVHVVWEKDYRYNPQLEISKCIKFLQS